MKAIMALVFMSYRGHRTWHDERVSAGTWETLMAPDILSGKAIQPKRRMPDGDKGVGFIHITLRQGKPATSLFIDMGKG